MKKLSVFSYVLIILLSLTLLSIGTISLYSIKTLSDFIYSEVETTLREEAQLIHNLIPDGTDNSPEILQSFSDNIRIGLKIRITLISPDGKILADSHKDYRQMENHSDRPEIIDAVNGIYGRSTRFSLTLSQYMLYLAIPPGSKNIVVRVALPLDHIRVKFSDTLKDMTLFSVIILLIAVVVSIFTAKKFTAIIKSIKKISEHYAKGDFSKKLPEDGPKEVSLLKISINSMGEQLQEIVNEVSVQKNELRAMLNSMVDSVILLNTNLEVIEMNPAAEELFKVSFAKCRKKSFKNIVDNEEITSLVEKSFNDEEYNEETVCFSHGLVQYLHIRCTPINDPDSSNKGILLVMNNMTRMKQLENMRKDFVANVSHELKTPITLINGFVETLLDGAMNDMDKLDHFLHVINRHSSRINHIIDDLLILSRIEDNGTNIHTEEVSLYDVIFSAYTSALNNAEREHIAMQIDCDDSIKIQVNPVLMEQAIFNLINNAIKYSGKGSKVIIIGSIENKNIIISVTDNGKGIEEEQLDRIFERFYRINRKQSKKLGGTGLGLSIVKHIALAHSGTVHVKSNPGQGSSFIISLPIL